MQSGRSYFGQPLVLEVKSTLIFLIDNVARLAFESFLQLASERNSVKSSAPKNKNSFLVLWLKS